MAQPPDERIRTLDSPPTEGVRSSCIRLFGLTISGLRCATGLFPGHAGRPDYEVSVRVAASDDPSTPIDAPGYRSPTEEANAEPDVQVWSRPDVDLIRIRTVGDIRISGHRIAGIAGDPADRSGIEVAILGLVMAYLLERRGIVALHSSGVVVEDRAIGFLATAEGGKTSLAATFLAAGHALLTDDILPVEDRAGELVARPGYPALRMWPDAADHFLGGHGDLPPVSPRISKRWVPVDRGGFGRFAEDPLPLARLYLPRRVASAKVHVEPVAPVDAMLELLRNSFVGSIAAALGWQPRRLPVLARIAREVPVRRLVYPAGFEHLPRVREAILADLERDR